MAPEWGGWNRTTPTYGWVFQPPHFSPSVLFPTTNPPMSNPGKSSCSQSLILVSHRGGSRLGYSTLLIGKNKWVRPTDVSKLNTESVIRRCNGRLWTIESCGRMSAWVVVCVLWTPHLKEESHKYATIFYRCITRQLRSAGDSTYLKLTVPSRATERMQYTPITQD